MDTSDITRFNGIDLSSIAELTTSATTSTIKSNSNTINNNINSSSINDAKNEHIYHVSGTNGYNDHMNHSRQSSRSSDTSSGLANISSLQDKLSDKSATEDISGLQLNGGYQLLEESGTELSRSAPYKVGLDSSPVVTAQPVIPARTPNNNSSNMSTGVTTLSNGTGTAKALAARSPYTSPPIDTIPTVDINIPADANITSFNCDQLASFLRCLNVEDRIISHLHRKKVDGKRFSRLRDSELDSLGMQNPVIVYFRDKSNVKAAKKQNYFRL